ncbi:hypothetical protein F383_04669 [Gossypium arboreum]|uniref:Uncharacterized protein n=1 Tax=Gossypium arboreum TaxID=29729 RepID=A0A0B0PD89_GOSAR|nr:hypothetical protein F383_04669 [Gossypium arboreum]
MYRLICILFNFEYV